VASAPGGAAERGQLAAGPEPFGLGEPQADVLDSLGELSLRLAGTADGQKYHAQALAIARDIGAQREEARALEGTGRCHLHDGHVVDGTTLLREALAIYKRIGTAAASGVVEKTLTTLPN
jgi:hypothetical protein